MMRWKRDAEREKKVEQMSTLLIDFLPIFGRG
jgi:hypothetical protein